MSVGKRTGMTVFRPGPHMVVLGGAFDVHSGGGTAAPAWVPTDIPGCVLWLDASAITGLVDGDPVGTWSDLSGNLNHATQTITAAKPTYKTAIQNGLPVVRFDSNDWMRNNTIGALEELTLYMVRAGKFSWGWFSFGAYSPEFYGNNPGGLAAWPVGAWTDLLPGLDTWLIAEWWRESGGYGAALNGTESALNPIANAYSNTPTTYEINAETYGGGVYTSGDYAEILVYDSALSAPNRALVEDYLGAKWGITVA